MNRKAKALLVMALVVVVGMAFRVSWNALRDIASTVGADHTAALLYPFVVDGLMALALVATLVLTGADRAFALRVLAGYTVASLVLNYVHGLVPALHAHAAGRMHLVDYAPANWVLVLLATSLMVVADVFGRTERDTAQVPTHEIDELLLLSSWFRRFPAELDRTVRAEDSGLRRVVIVPEPEAEEELIA